MARYTFWLVAGRSGPRVAAFWASLLALMVLLSASNSPASASPSAGTLRAGLQAGAYPGACATWGQVNDDAFGIPSNFDSNGDPVEPPPAQPYSSEEGFEVLVFNGRLYVGMEADNSFGARLWRTRAGVAISGSQADWEEVAADVAGNPFGVPDPVQNDHIDSLAEFDGYLYASTANRGSSTLGTRIFRSPTGDLGAWTDAIATYGAGFGDPQNTNFKDMQVFDGRLCGGTQNWDTESAGQPDWDPGAQVWCTADGTTWLQKNTNGFGDGANIEVWSGYVYDGALYFGVQNYGADRDSGADDVATLFRTADLAGAPAWAEVYHGDPDSRRVDILGDLNGYLYVSVRSTGGIVVLRSASGDAGAWSQVNVAGMDGDPNNFGAVVDSAAVYNGALYVGVANVATGFQVWRTAGSLQGGPLVDWVQIDDSGLGDPNNYYTELIPFNGYLYAWTSNYFTGQQVRRSKCPICQSRVIDGAGTYTFDGVGAEVAFTQENLDSLEVCAYPNAGHEESMGGDWPVRRHYEISPSPADGAFTADLTLAYTDGELATATARVETTTFLQRWAGSTWEPCPPEQRARDIAANTATCTGAIAFSPWAITARCPNFDGVAAVSVGDVQVLAGHWREQSGDAGWDPQFDLDDNQRVDIIDIVAGARALGGACP